MAKSRDVSPNVSIRKKRLHNAKSKQALHTFFPSLNTVDTIKPVHLKKPKAKSRSRTPVSFHEDAQGQESPNFGAEQSESDEDNSPRDFVRIFEVEVAAKPIEMEDFVAQHKTERKALKKVKSKRKIVSVPTHHH